MSKRIMSYMGHVIWMNEGIFEVALKHDGTDEYYETIQDAMKAIENYEQAR